MTRKRSTLRVSIAALLLAAANAGAQSTSGEPQCGALADDAARGIEACTKVINSGRYAGPELAKAYYSRGTGYSRAGDFERAIADLSVAIQLDPKLPAAYYNRALAQSALGESDRAIADYDAALALNARDADVLRGRAVEWIAKGDFKRALADFDASIRLGESAVGYFGRARAKYYASDFTGAASDFYRAHSLAASQYSAIWLYLARKRADIPGEKTLGQEAGTQGAGSWPAPIVALYLGKSTPRAVQEAAVDLNAARQRAQRCEANYYIAQWHILRGERDAALPLLRDAASACPLGFIEQEAAVAELRRLGR